MLPEGSSESEIAAFSDQLEEWNPNLDTTRLSDGQTVYTGPPISSNEIPSETKTSTVIPGKLSESQAKASGYAEVMIMAEKNISDLFKSNYRPDQGTWLFMEASNLEIEKPGFLDTFFRQEVGKQLSDDDRTFVRNVMAMADASIRDKSGAAVKEGELRSEIRRLFNRETAVGTVTDQARLDSSNFRRGILQSIINKAGPSKTRLQNSLKELVKPRSVFKLNTGDQLRDDLIKQYKLTPPSDG